MPWKSPEMSRVARHYGARPEIFRNVGWRTLVEFVVDGDIRGATPQVSLAGEPVTGAEIIRARSSG